MASENNSSLKSILFLVLTPLIGGLIGYGLRYVFEPQHKKVFAVQEYLSQNMIKVDNSLASGIVSEFRLKDIPNMNIRSFYLYSFEVKNGGNSGSENISVKVSTNETRLFLVPSPKIETYPENLKSAFNLSQLRVSSDSISETYSIPLLNPGEGIKLTYSLYSDSMIEKPKITGLVRKTDWVQVKNSDNPGGLSKEVFLSKPIKDFKGEDLFILFALCSAILGTLYLYGKILTENKLIWKIINSSLVMDEWKIAYKTDFKSGLHILNASYGSELKRKNVISKVMKSISNNKLEILVANYVLGGDPHKFTPKTLRIQLVKDGIFRQIEHKEKDIARID